MNVLFVVVTASVWFDLFSHRNAIEIKLKSALTWSLFWVILAIFFYVYLCMFLSGVVQVDNGLDMLCYTFQLYNCIFLSSIVFEQLKNKST